MRRWQSVELHYPLSTVMTASMRRYGQQTGESLDPERSHKNTWRGRIRGVWATGGHRPPAPPPAGGSIFQQVPVQIYEGLVNVTHNGTARSSVRGQKYWHRLLPVAERDAGALRGRKHRIFTSVCSTALNRENILFIWNG